LDAWLQSVAQQAGRMAMDYFAGSFEVTEKPDGSPVTTADLAIDRFLRQSIHNKYPHDLVLSEETPPPRAPDECRRVWLVDPIDGTAFFVARRPEWGVLLALWERREIVASIAHFPAMHLTLMATKGKGCRINGREVRVSTVCGEAAKVASKGKMLAQLHRSPWPFGRFPLEVIRVAGGELEGCVVSPNHMWGPYDIAWAMVAVREAGGRVTDEQNRPIQFDPLHAALPSVIVCSNGQIHNTLVREVREALGNGRS
jgi:myo-inositol-1(or 4)-monophosphatase